MKNFEFKKEKYSATSLLKYYYDGDLKGFNEGDVIDLQTGEVFPIADLFNITYTHIKELLDNVKNFSSRDEYVKVKSIYQTQMKNLKILELKDKLKQDTITLPEVEEWLSLMPYMERKSFGIAKYSNYITINHAKPKPIGLNRLDYSRFFELIYIMSYNNKVSYSNGKPVKRKDLCGILDFKSTSGFDKFIAKLKKHNMIIRTEPNAKQISFLMVNPAYAMRQIEIDLTTYNYFKDDLDDLLSPLEKKYIELKGNIAELNHMLQVDNS